MSNIKNEALRTPIGFATPEQQRIIALEEENQELKSTIRELEAENLQLKETIRQYQSSGDQSVPQIVNTTPKASYSERSFP